MRKKKFVFSTEPFPATRFPQFTGLPRIQQHGQGNTTGPTQTGHINGSVQMYARSPVESLEDYRREFGDQPGTEPSKLGNTIALMARKPKMVSVNRKQTYDQNRSDIVYKQNDSNTDIRLPHLSRTMSDHGQESKLMDDIRRVQNRIKELKYERNQFGAQQNNFEAIRPFLEIQNQNMVNLQMMILNQNKNNQHRCQPYEKPRSRERERVRKKPKNICSQAQQFSSQSISEQDQSQIEIAPPRINNHKHFVKKKGKVKPKKYNMAKIRKFRVAVIAVYFSLLFPKFANRFTIKRFKLHSAQFYVKEKKTEDRSVEFIDEMLKINVVDISQRIHEKRRKRSNSQGDNSAKLVITEQFDSSNNFQFFIGDIEEFLHEFLQKIESHLQKADIEEMLREVTYGNMPGSFPIDDYHIIEEMYRLTYHPQRLYLRISKEQSKALILNFIFMKIFMYDFLYYIKDKLEWKKKILKRNKLKNNQMIEVELATTQMYFSGILLHNYCMDIIKDWVETSEGNVATVDQANLPIPKKVMMFNQIGELEEALGAKKATKKKKHTSSEEVEGIDYRRLDIEQYEDNQFFKFNFIKNLDSFSQLIKMVQKSSSFQTEIKDKIMDIVDLLYEKMVEARRDKYKSLKQQLLLEEKYFLKGKINYTEIKIPKRTVEEKRFVKKLVVLIQENKENEVNDSHSIKSQEESGEADDDEEEEYQSNEDEEEQEEDSYQEQSEDQENEESAQSDYSLQKYNKKKGKK